MENRPSGPTTACGSGVYLACGASGAIPRVTVMRDLVRSGGRAMSKMTTPEMDLPGRSVMLVLTTGCPSTLTVSRPHIFCESCSGGGGPTRCVDTPLTTVGWGDEMTSARIVYLPGETFRKMNWPFGSARVMLVV